MLATPETIVQQLQWRYATKKFDTDRKIPADAWQALEQSMVLAPSSFGLQPWKFFVVTNPELRQELLPHTWKQSQVVDASHLVVFAIRKDIQAADVDRFLERMSAVQKTPVENLAGFGNVVKGFIDRPPYPLDVNEWSKRQLYIALGEFMTAAAMMGIDTCPLEGFMPAEYDRVLGLTEKGYAATVLCAAGYRAADDKSADRPKVRYETAEVVEYI
jgi:nitroreductase